MRHDYCQTISLQSAPVVPKTLTNKPSCHRQPLTKLTMHLSTIHGSSYYSESVNYIAKMPYTPLNTVIRRATQDASSNEGSGNWKWYLGSVGIFVLLMGLCIGQAFFRSAKHKWKKDRWQQKHAQWYGQQQV